MRHKLLTGTLDNNNMALYFNTWRFNETTCRPLKSAKASMDPCQFGAGFLFASAGKGNPMKKSKRRSSPSEKDFADKVDRLWAQKKESDSLLEKRLGKSVADSASRFREAYPQFTEEEVIEMFETPM